MKKVHIVQKLKDLGYPVESLKLGDFDSIGEMTAKKERHLGSALYATAGRYYRPNYERGLLIYALIRSLNISSYLEIGTGRGYSALCAAWAMSEKQDPWSHVTSIDVKQDVEHWKRIRSIFPGAITSRINLVEGKSSDVLPTLGSYDMIYVDGDHTELGVESDWQLCKDRFNKVILFDDYHLPTKREKDIECAAVIDRIDMEKELVIMDRRVFVDDRRLSDDDIDYGQVLIMR
jgi:predicted O-methyltransferase YrrM